MFFIDAKELGEEFFAPGVLFRPQRRYLFGLERGCSRQLSLFASWVVDAALPKLIEANPTRQPEVEAARVKTFKGHFTLNTDVHRDEFATEQTRIIIGVMPDGTTASTMFPKSPDLEDDKIDFWTPDRVSEHFWEPPQQYASVFDPNLESHVAPVIPRNVVRTGYLAILPCLDASELEAVRCPQDPNCIDPTKTD
jgi:hypothetical protein